VTLTAVPAACPHCDTALVTERGAQPWCPACEWNLDRYEPDRRPPELGLRWFDRRSHRLAYRLTTREYARLVGRPVGRAGGGGPRVVLLVAAVFLLATILALLALGGYLVVTDFPSLRIVPGALLILVALALWPRLGRLDPHRTEVTRDAAPALFGLVDEVAAAVGAPVPQVVTIDSDFNASAGAVGWRRRRVLRLGLCLWGVLPPQQRVALLGHELGHFVNGDVRRGPLTRIPLTTLGTLAELLRPAPGATRGAGLVGMLGELFAATVMAGLRSLVLAVHIVLVWVGLRDAQRAEYLADELAARAAGSAAAAALAETLIAAEAMVMAATREARRGGGPAEWRVAADEARVEGAPRLVRLRQLSVRDEVSMFATHPPSGLRARMIESGPAHGPAVELSDERSARIDAELGAHFQSTRRSLAAS